MSSEPKVLNFTYDAMSTHESEDNAMLDYEPLDKDNQVDWTTADMETYTPDEISTAYNELVGMYGWGMLTSGTLLERLRDNRRVAMQAPGQLTFETEESAVDNGS